jgi:hypothetical protein
MAGMIRKPVNISYRLNFVPITTGSVNEVKKLVVAIHTKQIEAFENFIDPKKVNQCRPTMTPIPINWSILILGIYFKRLPNRIKNNKLILVSNTRHQTNSKASRLITFPSMAVKPKSITAICKSI